MINQFIMDGTFSIIVFLTAFPCFVKSTVFCGDQICHGVGAFCCELDSGDDGCCWDTLVYDFWWFWVLWIVVFLLILACVASYWRRRLRNRRLAIMANSQYPTYGTVVQTQTSIGTRHTGASGPAMHSPWQPSPYMAYPQAPPSYATVGTTAPPSYAASEATKNNIPPPPAYSA